ncbi:hypothetical protein [Pedobacter sp.]|uniref:hypothetical protein n=1 Tax=Pedobacter sp. TaxID=1411316 RepID=UPI00396C4B7D
MQADNTRNKTDKTKVYFLMVVIAALLGINGYLYFSNKSSASSPSASLNTEQERLKLEVEKIEVELDRVNLSNVNLNEKLIEEQELARKKIEELKEALRRGELTQKDLDEAGEKISNLRNFVKIYNNKVTLLEQENVYLKGERDSLKSVVSTSNDKNVRLEKENKKLTAKVRVGESLKAYDIKVSAFKIKQSGKITGVTRASTANQLTIDFALIPNDLAEKKYHRVFLRVIDPAGNLIADENNMFEAEGQKMQYSTAIEFSFNNDNTRYKIDWINPRQFMKGIYTLILYSGGSVMGKSEIELR